MPVYEYICRGCGEKNEFLEVTGAPAPVKKCAGCGGVRFKRGVTSFSFHPEVTLEDLGVPIIKSPAPAAPQGPPGGVCPYEKAEIERLEKEKKENENPGFIL